MRATGILRRIDDLGRIVIPREIRKGFGIAEGDPLEIFVDQDARMICLQPYEKKSVTNILIEAIQEVEKCKGFGEAEHLRAVLVRNGYEVN